jgi:hypothetical protein
VSLPEPVSEGAVTIAGAWKATGNHARQVIIAQANQHIEQHPDGRITVEDDAYPSAGALMGSVWVPKEGVGSPPVRVTAIQGRQYGTDAPWILKLVVQARDGDAPLIDEYGEETLNVAITYEDLRESFDRADGSTDHIADALEALRSMGADPSTAILDGLAALAAQEADA